MVGRYRRSAVGMALGWALGLPGAGFADDPASKGVEDNAKPAAADFALPGEDPPRAFVPARPRTVEERKKVESLRYYAAARALEDRRQLSEAIKTLEQALAADPESIPVLRRLGRLNFALGREAAGIAVSRKALSADPSDVKTVAMLVEHHKDDLPAAESMLKEAAGNPKLDKNSVGALYIEYELGNLYEATRRIDKAATSFARVVEALDDKANARLSNVDLARFLGDDAAQAYHHFGQVFFQARKVDLAIRAFQRGLVYDPDDPSLILALGVTFVQTGRPADALVYVEKFLKRQPPGRETYDLLARILVALKRENEIIPRLEKYAEADPKNAPLQHALADRYKMAGQLDKARAIFNAFPPEQREAANFPEDFARLLRERKTDELLALLVKISVRLKKLDPVKNQIDELVKDPAYTDEVLDAGLKMISARPPAMDPREAWSVLFTIAEEGKRPEKLASLCRWSLERMPNPLVYAELIRSLVDARKFAEAEVAFRELFAKYNDERTARNLVWLAQVQAQAEKFDEATATVREALKLEPNELEAVRVLAILLNQAGKTNEAIDAIREALKADVANPRLNSLLGSFLMQAGRNDEAIALFKSLLDKFPNNEDVVMTARQGLSTIYTGLGDFAKGEAELEILFAKNPDDPGLNNDLGYLYADQGKNLEKAEAMIRKAVAEDPDNYAYLDSLGWVLFKRGKMEEARVSLEKASADSRSDTTIPDHLGDVYFQLQEIGKARGAWEKALKLATESKPPDKRVPEIRKKLDTLKQVQPTPRPAKGDSP